MMSWSRCPTLPASSSHITCRTPRSTALCMLWKLFIRRSNTVHAFPHKDGGLENDSLPVHIQAASEDCVELVWYGHSVELWTVDERQYFALTVAVSAGHQLLQPVLVLVILSVIVCLNCRSILTSSRVLLYSCVLLTAFYRINEWINDE